jgi:hypothetical protein
MPGSAATFLSTPKVKPLLPNSRVQGDAAAPLSYSNPPGIVFFWDDRQCNDYPFAGNLETGSPGK